MYYHINGNKSATTSIVILFRFTVVFVRSMLLANRCIGSIYYGTICRQKVRYHTEVMDITRNRSDTNKSGAGKG